ncbi:hypothetical protein QBC45DRAFT_423826 [Copromyces sp. CBS 386.78]|nr:hypothetical protein QBC45DRAFT_423826 [Copromyces sp. CBS 386.78]
MHERSSIYEHRNHLRSSLSSPSIIKHRTWYDIMLCRWLCSLRPFLVLLILNYALLPVDPLSREMQTVVFSWTWISYYVVSLLGASFCVRKRDTHCSGVNSTLWF